MHARYTSIPVDLKVDFVDVQNDIAGESETGKIYRANFKDKSGHSVLVMHPGRQVIFYLLVHFHCIHLCINVELGNVLNCSELALVLHE